MCSYRIRFAVYINNHEPNKKLSQVKYESETLRNLQMFVETSYIQENVNPKTFPGGHLPKESPAHPRMRFKIIAIAISTAKHSQDTTKYQHQMNKLCFIF